MTKRSYSFEPGGPKRLELSWKGFYKNMTLKLDGIQIGEVPDSKTLTAGQEFRLVDGSIVKVQMVSNLAGTEIQVLRNGQPLPGSASNPETRVKTAAGLIFFIAGLNILIGLIATFFNSDILYQIGVTWLNILFGVFFLVMGLLVRKRSKVALILSIVVFSLNAVLAIFGSILAGVTPSIPGLLMRVVLIIPMVQAVKSIDQLKKRNNPPAVPPVV